MTTQKQFGPQAHTYRSFYVLAQLIQTGTHAEIVQRVRDMQADPLHAGPQAQDMLRKLYACFTQCAVPYTVFAKGNGKLPFYAFSALPAVSCPGAGACLDYCYSFTSWRFAHAFGRQAQNSFLLRFAPYVIRDALQAIAARKRAVRFALRLYVDGDFSSARDVALWMDMLRDTPTADAYGYSKSFHELLTHHALSGQWPSNYLLNVSEGHRHSAETVAQVMALPITRGTFSSVDIGRKVKSTDHGTRETSRAVRDAFGAKCFACPGKCGTCTPHGHACGSPRFRGIDVVIARH